MRFEHRYEVSVPREVLWDVLMDVHAVASIIEGVEEVIVVADDRYEGRLAVKMGPVRLKFAGEVRVTRRDRPNWTGVLEANARDRKAGGGFQALLAMRLDEAAADASHLHVNLDTTFLGRIGELGRPLIKKKINTMMDSFVDQLRARHASGSATDL